MPLFAGDAVDREAIYWHFPHYGNQGGRPACWVVTGTWKLIEHFEDSRVDLFNLSRDPSETHECGEAHPDIRLRLHAMLKRWRNDVQATIPPPNHHYPCRSPQVANNAHD